MISKKNVYCFSEANNDILSDKPFIEALLCWWSRLYHYLYLSLHTVSSLQPMNQLEEIT